MLAFACLLFEAVPYKPTLFTNLIWLYLLQLYHLAIKSHSK